MRILLANPPCRIDIGEGLERAFVRAGSRWPFSIIKRKEKPLDYLPFPFYLGYTAALLEAEGFDVQVLDSVALNDTEGEFIEKATRLGPDVVLFESQTPTSHHDLLLISALKEAFSPVVCLSGPHVTTFPQEILRKSEHVDYVFLREYELNFLEFAKRLRSKMPIDDVKGLAFMEGGAIHLTDPETIEPLDLLPPPARHLFPCNEAPDIGVYWDAFCQYRPAAQMHSSRGCPFRCNFCLWIQVMYQDNSHRCFSSARVVDEMEEVVHRYGVREIYFDDDIFTGTKSHVLGICEEIRRRNLRVHWSAMGDAMVPDEEMIDAMADSGCIGMKFGVESGSREVLKAIKKPVRLERVRKIAEWCARRHIKTHATFSLGLLTETRESMSQTLEFAKTLDVDSIQFSISTPFPGTRFYEETKRAGLLRTESWGDFDGSSNCTVHFQNLSTAEVVDLYNRAIDSWLKVKLRDPKWVLRQVYNMNRVRRGQGWRPLLARGHKAMKALLSLT